MTTDLPIAALSRLLDETPGLLGAVNGAPSAADAAAILAAAAQEAGIAVEHDRLVRHMAANAGRDAGALSDADLDQAHGGNGNAWRGGGSTAPSPLPIAERNPGVFW